MQDPNIVVSPMQGTVLFVAQTGNEYPKGAIVITLESMKMQHDIVAESDGVLLELYVHESQTVKAGDKLFSFASQMIALEEFEQEHSIEEDAVRSDLEEVLLRHHLVLMKVDLKPSQKDTSLAV